MQQFMLLHTLSARGDDVLFNQFGYVIDGPFDPAAFEGAWADILRRHAILRTIFLWDGLQAPVQVVRERVPTPLTCLDWRADDVVTQDDRYRAFLREDAARGFDLTAAPLMRLTLIRVADARWRFVWSSHHLIVDRWCIGTDAEGRGEIRWDSPVPFGWAAVADVDGDGLGEILCANRGRITVLKGRG